MLGKKIFTLINQKIIQLFLTDNNFDDLHLKIDYTH